MNTSLEVGQVVALSMRPGAAPLRCYVGEIQAIDERGLRLTLVDWMSGRMVGNDFFAPWSEITSALVCTKNHDAEMFGESAKNWQTQMSEL